MHHVSWLVHKLIGVRDTVRLTPSREHSKAVRILGICGLVGMRDGVMQECALPLSNLRNNLVHPHSSVTHLLDDCVTGGNAPYGAWC